MRHGTESISFLGPKIWDLVSSDIKLSLSLVFLKEKLKNGCLCSVRVGFVKYLQHVRFIQ